MGWIAPQLPDYDPEVWAALPFAERARLACQDWALHGYGTPLAIYLAYAIKLALYVAGWVFFCGLSPSLGEPGDLAGWWLAPLAFQKAILWSLLFEVLGLGCGCGPLTGRYRPPIGGCLYFLRTGTVRLPLIDLPLLRGTRRTVVDVLLYTGVIATLLIALCAPTIQATELWPVLACIAALSLRDKTIFLAARGEHYVVTTLIFVVASSQTEWLAGAQGVACALWFFAGFSKLNHHFPTVVGVMVCNSPLVRSQAIRKRMYRAYPTDLRPSRLAVFLAHFGTALELGIPLVLLLVPGTPGLIVGMGLVLVLHSYIVSNVPLGVPIEWNILVVYAAFALFWGQPEISVLDAGWGPGAIVLGCSVLVPILGNLYPARISFLPSMRYYAGNWAMSLWLFKDGCDRRLHDHLRIVAPPMMDQLSAFYDERTIQGLLGRVMAFRLMHLHGRSLGRLLPEAIDAPLESYEWVDGELVAGMVLGWNFGDGHLHDERMLAIIQEACNFEEGELRCIFVESQPLFGGELQYRIHDARTGCIRTGGLDVNALRQAQPWSTG